MAAPSRLLYCKAYVGVIERRTLLNKRNVYLGVPKDCEWFTSKSTTYFILDFVLPCMHSAEVFRWHNMQLIHVCQLVSSL